MSYQEAPFPHLYSLAHNVMEQREQKKRDLKVIGADLMPRAGAALVGYSHREASDPWVAGASLERAMYMMSKDELWTKKYLYIGYFLQLLGGFPVNKDNPGHSTIRKALDLMKEGKVVGIFGESSRYADPDDKVVRGPKIGEVKEGIGFLSVLGNVAIYAGGISHLTSEEIEYYGTDVKRVVYRPGVLPNWELDKKAVVADVTQRHKKSLQSAYDEANERARVAAEAGRL